MPNQVDRTSLPGYDDIRRFAPRGAGRRRGNGALWSTRSPCSSFADAIRGSRTLAWPNDRPTGWSCEINWAEAFRSWRSAILGTRKALVVEAAPYHVCNCPVEGGTPDSGATSAPVTGSTVQACAVTGPVKVEVNQPW